MKNMLMNERQQTVVIVGWGGGADLPHITYKKALANIQTSAIWLGEIVTELRKMKPSIFIWGVGHSLGAHLLGLAGRGSPDTFNRITGLYKTLHIKSDSVLEFSKRMHNVLVSYSVGSIRTIFGNKEFKLAPTSNGCCFCRRDSF